MQIVFKAFKKVWIGYNKICDSDSEWFHCISIGATGIGFGVAFSQIINGHYNVWSFGGLIVTSCILGYWWIQWFLEQIS